MIERIKNSLLHHLTALTIIGLADSNNYIRARCLQVVRSDSGNRSHFFLDHPNIAGPPMYSKSFLTVSDQS